VTNQKKKLFASFSGGRTSAFMTKWLLDNCQDEYEIKVVFANTGQEHEATLEFVDRCDKEFEFGVVWVEAVVHQYEKRASSHRIVTFETASRKGEPFEAIIQKYGIPNTTFPHCTRELKLNPMKSYMASIGWTDYLTAIGIRTDETRRVNAKAADARLIYPLIDMVPMDKQDINDWWDEQTFNLGLLEHQGNCKWCWKKSLSKHFRLIDESPAIYGFPRRIEKLYGDVGPNPVGGPRVFFRQNMSTDDLFAFRAECKPKEEIERMLAGRQLNLDLDGGCTESCEVYPMLQAA
jgi:hypothetical protein